MKKPQQMFLYLTVFIIGAAVLILEILGTRVISPFYGTTIFVWSSLITVTLGALSLGYFLGGRIVDRKPDFQLLYKIILGASIFIILILKIDQLILPFTERFGMKFGPLVASLILFAPSFLILGMITPMAIRLSSKKIGQSGSTAGRIFALSTLGSVIGALLAGFFLLPIFSLVEIFLGLAFLLAIISMIGFFNKETLSLFIIFLFLAMFVPKFKEEPKNTFKLIEHKQSFFGDIKVVKISKFTCLYVNGSGQTCIDEKGKTDGFFQRFLKDEVPKLGTDEESKVLLLGLGGGGILSLLPRNTRIDIVEIDSEVVKIAQEHFGFNETEQLNLILDDARHFLTTTEEKQYDLILENIALGNAVPSHILTRESFSDMKRLLKPNGVLLVHIGTHEIGGDNLFNEAVYSTVTNLFDYNIALSSQKDQVANLVLYLSDKPIKYNFGGEFYDADLSFNSSLVVTDNRNPLDYWYLSNAISQRENTKPLGNDIFYAE